MLTNLSLDEDIPPSLKKKLWSTLARSRASKMVKAISKEVHLIEVSSRVPSPKSQRCRGKEVVQRKGSKNGKIWSFISKMLGTYWKIWKNEVYGLSRSMMVFRWQIMIFNIREIQNFLKILWILFSIFEFFVTVWKTTLVASIYIK